jgi:hypothetical protein
MKYYLLLFLLGFYSVPINAQDSDIELDTEGLLYANLNNNINELAFDKTGKYVGIMSNRYLVLFNEGNIVLDKLDLFNIRDGAGGNWFNIRKVWFRNDTISINNINSVQKFVVRNDSLKLLTTDISSGLTNRSFGRHISMDDEVRLRNHYLANLKGWDFGYLDKEEKGNKLKPSIWFVKGEKQKELDLPSFNFNFDGRQLWFKRWSVLTGVYDNHFEMGNNSVYFSFPYQDKLIAFNTISAAFTEIDLPSIEKGSAWYVFVDPFTKIPYLTIEKDGYFSLYYFNQKMEYVFLTDLNYKPQGIVNYKVYEKRSLKEGKINYTGHFLNPIENEE